jgi:hypothetical protein
VAEMGALDHNIDFFKFLERSMVRERNKVCHCLNEAMTAIDETLQGKAVL